MPTASTVKIAERSGTVLTCPTTPIKMISAKYYSSVSACAAPGNLVDLYLAPTTTIDSMALGNVFGGFDPCPGEPKVLEITYTCS